MRGFVTKLFSTPAALGVSSSRDQRAMVEGPAQTVRAHEDDRSPAALTERAREITAVDREVLVVKTGGVTLFSRSPDAYYSSRMRPGEYGWIAEDGREVFLDERTIEGQPARDALVFFGAVLLIVLAYPFLSSPRFAFRVSDPIHVMKRGTAEKDHSIEVRIPETLRDDYVTSMVGGG